jgi:C4-dicarboxylate-specific signal transduction histidine kinase
LKGNILLIAVATFIISLIVTLNLFFNQNYQAEMAQQMSKQQLLLAETISGDIDRNMSHLKDMTVSLSNLLGDVNLEGAQLEKLIHDAFSEMVSDSELALRVYGARGELKYISPAEASTQSDPSLIEAASRSEPGTALVLENPYAYGVSFVAPFSEPEGHTGTVVLDIPVDAITARFLLPVRTTGPSHAWMMDQTGTLLYHPFMPEMVGKNLNKADATCFECHTSFEVEKRILQGGGAAVQSYVAPFGEDKIIASARVSLSPEQAWFTCVSIPYSEVTASIRKSMRLHSILIVAIFAATGVGAFTMVVINKKRLKAEERARHEAELEQYAHQLESAVEKRTLELISEKEKLDAIVGAMEVGLFLADRRKNITWVNKTLEDWFGGKEAAKSITMDDIYGGTEIQSSIAHDRMIQELVHHKLGQKEGYFQITTTPLADPEGNMQLLGLISDVTEIKKFEEQMAHSEKLASLGRLTAGIAHEIGNPLTSVSSFLQILREMETEDFKKESLDTIMFHITRIADIVRHLSGLSKLPPTELKEVQINDVITTSLGLLQFDRRAKELTVDKKLGDIPQVVADANQLSQVFVNLILNAVDAMDGGGTMLIRSGRRDGEVYVEFEDDGPGISEDSINRVFDPFFTTKEKGTGLGLSVSYGIIRRLGGDITAENVKPHGARFTVTMPVRSE